MNFRSDARDEEGGDGVGFLEEGGFGDDGVGETVDFVKRGEAISRSRVRNFEIR